jgi:hypothetical protein
MNRSVINICLPTTMFVFFSLNLLAQTNDTIMTKEVEVTKAYRPTITDAFKINDIPRIDEEEYRKPSFDYTISSQPIFSTFSVNTLQAAKITGKPKEENGYGLLKLGAGNYKKPYAELFFNNTGSNNTLFEVHLKHLSSDGKIKLAGGDKVDAPFSDNLAEMYVNRNFSNVNLRFNAAYNRNGLNYYGYPVTVVPTQLLAEDQKVNYFGKKQAFSKAAFNLNLKNAATSGSSLDLGLDLEYSYFTTKTLQKEHNGGLQIHFGKRIGNLMALLDAGANYYQVDSVLIVKDFTIGKRQEFLVKTNPAVRLENKTTSLKVGGKFYADIKKGGNPTIRIAPDVLLNFMPVKGILSFFAGVDGKYIQNTYSEIAYQNPFVDPEHDVKSSMQRYRIFGGLNGKLSSKTNYKVSVEYSSVKDQPFYYLQAFVYPVSGSVDPVISNTDFEVLYDELGKTAINLEIYHTASEKLNLLLTGNYYSYNLKEQTNPWNLPSFDAKLSVSYKVNERLELSSDVFVVGERKGLIVEYNGFPATPWSYTLLSNRYKIYPMDMVIDLNAKGTYSITGNFAAFVQLNNFGFQSYERWLGYPVQSFNLLGGISYSF